MLYEVITGVVKLPSDLAYDKAVMAEPLSCGLAALRANRIQPGDRNNFV